MSFIPTLLLILTYPVLDIFSVLLLGTAGLCLLLIILKIKSIARRWQVPSKHLTFFSTTFLVIIMIYAAAHLSSFTIIFPWLLPTLLFRGGIEVVCLLLLIMILSAISVSRLRALGKVSTLAAYLLFGGPFLFPITACCCCFFFLLVSIFYNFFFIPAFFIILLGLLATGVFVVFEFIVFPLLHRVRPVTACCSILVLIAVTVVLLSNSLLSFALPYIFTSFTALLVLEGGSSPAEDITRIVVQVVCTILQILTNAVTILCWTASAFMVMAYSFKKEKISDNSEEEGTIEDEEGKREKTKELFIENKQAEIETANQTPNVVINDVGNYNEGRMDEELTPYVIDHDTVENNNPDNYF